MKLKTKKLFLPAVLIWICGTTFMWLTCGWLFTWIYKIEPLIWVEPEVMMSASNFIGSSLIGLVLSFFFVLVYGSLYKGIPGKGVKKGMTFGFLVSLIASLGALTMPFYMTVATTVVIYWAIQGIILNTFIKGALVGWLYK